MIFLLYSFSLHIYTQFFLANMFLKLIENKLRLKIREKTNEGERKYNEPQGRYKADVGVGVGDGKKRMREEE